MARFFGIRRCANFLWDRIDKVFQQATHDFAGELHIDRISSWLSRDRLIPGELERSILRGRQDQFVISFRRSIVTRFRRPEQRLTRIRVELNRADIFQQVRQT